MSIPFTRDQRMAMLKVIADVKKYVSEERGYHYEPQAAKELRTKLEKQSKLLALRRIEAKADAEYQAAHEARRAAEQEIDHAVAALRDKAKADFEAKFFIATVEVTAATDIETAKKAVLSVQ
jgi:hypothetical protein